MKSYVGLSHYHHSTFVITHKHVVDISVWQFPVNPSYFQLRFTCHKYYIIGSLIFPNEVLQFCQGGYQIQCSIIIPVWHAKPGCSQFTIWNNVHESPSETMFTIHCLKWLPVSDEVCVLAVVMSFKQPIFVVCHPFAHFPRHFAVVTNFYWYDAPKILIVDIQFMVSICFWKNCLIVVFTLQYAHSCNTFIIHTCCLILPAPDFRDSPLILWLPWVPHLAAIIQLWFRAWGFWN